jgi:hypothetical protein
LMPANCIVNYQSRFQRSSHPQLVAFSPRVTCPSRRPIHNLRAVGVCSPKSTMVRATSIADPTKSATATVVVNPDPTLVPMVGPVTPDSGSGASQLFQFQARPRAGELNWAAIVINDSLNANHGCFIDYRPLEGDIIMLSSDDATNENWSWVSGGPKALGEPGSLSNSQCTINTGASSVTRNGTALQINLSISFKPAFTGTRQIFMAAQDTGGNLVAWPYIGYWVVP